MKFTGNTQEIMEGISIVTRALSPKPAKPVYEGVLVECDDNTIRITCSDGQFSIRWTGNVTVQDPGSAIIQGRLFSDLMRKLPNTSTTITTDDKSATVTYNKSRSRLATIPGQYPQHSELDNPTTFTIPSTTLRDLILHVIPAISSDSTRLILTGALLEVTPSHITMVSLDGFRLALKHSRQQTNLNGLNPIRAVIPRKALVELSKLLPNTPDPVTLTLNQSAISVTIGATQLTSSLLAGEFLDYSRLIPESFSTSILISKPDLQDSIERASLMAREGKSNLIRLEVANDSVAISSRADTGTIYEEVPCNQQGENITISFNSSYIADSIRNSPDDTISISFNSPTSPAVISPQSSRDWLYLVLPVRTA